MWSPLPHLELLDRDINKGYFQILLAKICAQENLYKPSAIHHECRNTFQNADPTIKCDQVRSMEHQHHRLRLVVFVPRV